MIRPVSLFPFALLSLAPLSQAATLTGLWEFNNASNIGKATVGNDLVIVGTAPTHSASMSDGTTSLNGVVATVAGPANYLRATHGIAPNGGGSGSYVNEWSIAFDVFSPVASRNSWRALFQTNQSNSNDADYFIRNTNDTLGINSLGYSATGINDSQWTRIVVTFNLGTTLPSDEIKTYVNGTLFATHNDMALDGTYALDPTLLLFADNDNENASLNVGSVAVFDGALTASEVTALGGVANAIPEPSAAVIGGLGVLSLAFRRTRRQQQA